MKISRLPVLLLSFVFLFSCQPNDNGGKPAAPKRLIIIMFDGFGMSYYRNARMPYLQKAVEKGFFKEVRALMPTVTNANNASICTGTFPEENGITGNYFLDERGHGEYMENKNLLMAPTIFEKLKKLGLHSALVSSKKKSISLLPAGTDIAISPETADSSWTRRLGKPSPIYSAEVNYWSMKAALDILNNHPEIKCLYIHTTDYPMHMWAPEEPSSMAHLAQMDKYIHYLSVAAPDAMILITADHDVNHKDRCIDIEQALALQNIKVKAAVSAEKDKYLKHHRGFGGTSYIYLNDQADSSKVREALLKTPGIEKVLTRGQAANRYHLMPSRIGHLVALADSVTVFGTLEGKAEENLPAGYRTHGSEYETRVPLIILNAPKLPPASYFNYNKDLTAWLFEAPYADVLKGFSSK